MPMSITTGFERKPARHGCSKPKRPARSRPPTLASTFCTSTVRPFCVVCCGRCAIRRSRFAPSIRSRGDCGWKTGKRWISTSFSTCPARSAVSSDARGPDSEYGLYIENGARRCYFDTSAMSHTLNEPIYIVEPYAPGTRLTDNGLPIFPVYYSNDDDGSRKFGHDSRLMFTAPAEGTYLARVTDVRGYGGPEFKYTLTIREPQPDFHVSLQPDKLSVAKGGGQRFVVALDRVDDFEGPVRVEMSGIPAGYRITSPLVVEKGHNAAEGTLHAEAAAKPLQPEAWKALRITATASIDGHLVVKPVNGFREVNLGPSSKVVVHLRPEQTGREVVIRPGESVTAMLEIERHGYDGELRFEVENLPHGVIVDNIGLNGIMVRAGETQRQVFLTAAKWVSPSVRLIHAVADREGGQTSLPLPLRVTAKAQ